MKCAVIVLAAGSSSRLGRPKQLLVYKGKTLLEHSVDVALEARVRRVIVVLGANSDLVRGVLKDKPVHIAFNKDWNDWMASSIRRGITELQKIDPSSEAAILMVSDQPFVSPGLLKNILHAQAHESKPIVASQYENTLGPPVLFARNYFPELLQLTGDMGARKVIQRHPDHVLTIPFSEGNIDIDTNADWERLKV